MGDGRDPTGRDIHAAVALSRDVTWLLAAGLAIAGGFAAARDRRASRR
jgi:hypothetical protein